MKKAMKKWLKRFLKTLRQKPRVAFATKQRRTMLKLLKQQAKKKHLNKMKKQNLKQNLRSKQEALKLLSWLSAKTVVKN